MFNQNHQRVQINPKTVRRYFSDKKGLERALKIKKLLKNKPYCPELITANLTESYLDEARVSGNKLTTDKIEDKHVEVIAKTMKDLHSIPLTTLYKTEFADSFTQDFQYHPLKIFKAGLSGLSPKQTKKYSKYYTQVEKLEIHFTKQPAQLCLVHSDISPDNLFYTENSIALIDWNDSRLDLPLVDVYGFFQNYKLSPDLQKKFWIHYGKPDYWTIELDRFFKMLHRMFEEAPESISVIIPTHNRCPYKRVSLNPLATTVKSLMQNPNDNIIKNFIIADDCSTDYTFETYEYLKNKFNLINFIYFRNKTRCKASLSRRKAINRCPSQLFLMSDDDCIYPENFINNIYKLFKKIRLEDRNIAVLNIPFVNKGFKFNGSILLSKYGKTDFKNHWVHHNFDKQPVGIGNKEHVKVDTFDGLFFGVKEKFLSAGNYEDLRGFIVDYAEHIGMSWRLANKGYTFYAATSLKLLVNHLKFGDHIKNLDLTNCPVKYIGAMKRANKPFIDSGDRVHALKTLESLISSFTYFYFCISEEEGIKHIKKEHEYLSLDGPVNKEKLKAFKQGVLTALKIAKKKKIITEYKPYLEAYNKFL